MRKLLYLLALLPFTAMAATQIASVEHGTDSVILRFELYDLTDPSDCDSGITSSTSGLEINVSSDISDGYIDQFRQTDSTLETIATIGTYATPTATKARFEIIVANACTYELQMPNSIFDTVNANIITIAITDSTTAIIDSVYWVDLTPVSSTTLVDLIWDEDIISAHNSANTAGDQLGAIQDAILTDTGTTLDAGVTAAVVNSARNFLYQADITTVTNQTNFIVDGGDDPGATDFNDNLHLCVEDTDSSLTQACSRITAYNTGTDTWTIAAALPFTVAVGDTIFIPPPTNNILGTDEITAAVIATDAIGPNEIATNAIGATEIAANAIGASELATDAIGSDQIATDAIGADEIATSAIGAAEIAANAIGPSEIATDAFDADALAADAVTEIVAGMNDISTAEVNTQVDLALTDINLDHWVGTASGIPALPAGTYHDLALDDGSEVYNRATDSQQAIADGAGGGGPTASAIADAVWQETLADHSGGAGSTAESLDQIETDAALILADTGTDGVALASNSITAAVIAADAIGASEIAANAIGASEISADAIGSSELATGAITAAVIATDAIDADALSADAVDLIWDEVIESAGATYTGRCLLAALGAYVAGEYTTAGNTTTYQDTGGNVTRIVGTVVVNGRDTMSITCP